MHCEETYKKASRLLGMLKRIFGRFSPKTLSMVMNTYIRPVMEYASQAWAPWLQKDKDLLQRIYHRATKLVIGFHGIPYEERIERLNLFDSTYRRIRGDLILTYNILHTPGHPLESLFKRGSDRVTRKHRFTIELLNSRSNCRRYFFSVRTCFIWNCLPPSVVNCSSSNTFKLALDTHMRSHKIIEPSHWTHKYRHASFIPYCIHLTLPSYGYCKVHASFDH